MLVCLVAGAAVWLVGELWLWTIHDRIHIVEVLQRANEISRGPFLERAAGVFVRISIGAPIILFLAAQRQRLSAVGAFLGLALWGWVALPWALLPLVVIGAAAFGALMNDFFKNQEDAWLATWALLVLVGVLRGHNLRPAVLFTGNASDCGLDKPPKDEKHRPSSHWSGWSVFCGPFCHDWGRRAQLCQSGCSPRTNCQWCARTWVLQWRVDISLQHATGRLVVLAGEALLRSAHCGGHSGGSCRRFRVLDAPAAVGRTSGFIRLLQAKTSTGYYAETVGKMPLMWSKGPLEQVQLWKARRAVSSNPNADSDFWSDVSPVFWARSICFRVDHLRLWVLLRQPWQGLVEWTERAIYRGEFGVY